MENVDPETKRNRKEMVKLLKKLSNYSEWTATHAINVAKLVRDFGKTLGLNPNKLLTSAISHDTAKLDIDKRVLHKPGTIDDEERTYIQNHTNKNNLKYYMHRFTGDSGKIAYLGALYHHTSYKAIDFDVSQGVLTEEEGLIIKIITICDIFEALTSEDRPYRAGSTKFDALELMQTIPVLDKELLKQFKSWQYENFANEYKPYYIEKHRKSILDKHNANKDEYKIHYDKIKDSMDGMSTKWKMKTFESLDE